MSDIRGQSLAFWLLALVTGAAQFVWVVSCINRSGSFDLVSGCTAGGCIFLFLFNIAFAAKKALKGNKIPLTGATDIDLLSVSGVNYCRLKGLDHLATAQEKDASTYGRKIEPINSLRVFRDNVVEATLKEAIFMHGLTGFPMYLCSLVSLYRGVERGESPMFLFGCASSAWHTFIVSVMMAQTAFTIRYERERIHRAN